MKLQLLFVGARSACLQLGSEGLYELSQPVALTLNGTDLPAAETVVTSIYDLTPDTDYTLTAVWPDGSAETAAFHTEYEPCTMNVRDFGAIGDGVHEDTAAIQTAIQCCPRHGRVLIPAGDYRVLPLFMKSGIRLELARGARLCLETDRSRFPILPGMVKGTTEADDVNLGTWEGSSYGAYASLISGFDAEDIVIYGEGVADGCAQNSDWWHNCKVMRGAWRGNLLFLNHCRHVVLQGLTFRNSPSWNLHPYFSSDLSFLNLKVLAPDNSPNTDGCDPESCDHLLMAGLMLSVGDDCVAVKSGKLELGRRYKTPSTDIEIRHCLMERGHGGVTVGSEMAGGVTHLHVHDCLMRNTDRGLRVKTRRGRGKDGVIDDIVFDHVRMQNVLTPFTLNSLYFCDPDGHEDWVQTLEKRPVDETTPYIGTVTFRDIEADGAACAGYVLGLPERPVKELRLERVQVACDPDCAPFQPAMSDQVGTMNRTGFVFRHVDSVVLKDVTVTGQDGPSVQTEAVSHVEQ